MSLPTNYGSAKVVRSTHTVKHTVNNDDTLAIAVTNNVGVVLASAALPLAAVVIACIFKSEIVAMLDRVRTVSGLGLEASLDAVIQNTLPPVPAAEQQSVAPETTASPSSTLSAVEIIITSWLAVERELDKAVSHSGGSSSMSIRSKIEALSAAPAVPTGLRERVGELFNIRNRIIHSVDSSLSADSAQLYRENANRVIRELGALASS